MSERMRGPSPSPSLEVWLEKKLRATREAAFSAAIGRKNGAEYWSGYADALQDVLSAIKRREVRV